MGVAEQAARMRRAVFLDRDGVLNEPVVDPQDGVPESPLKRDDIRLCDGAAEAVIALREGGYELVVVTNQPAAAKGKTTIAELQAVNERVRELLAERGAEIATWKICLHHPDAIVPELGGACDCRKPAPGMLLEAASELDLSLAGSWMIGDGDADIGAGRAAGCRTVLVRHPLTAHRRSDPVEPDAEAADLRAAAGIVLGTIAE
jgi:D-glycero-D-manno-heptose 1,7-bisphosphate phosphatase